jgi:hypothetical protein
VEVVQLHDVIFDEPGADVAHIFPSLLVHRDESGTSGSGSQQVDGWLRGGTSRSSIVKKLIGSDREWLVCSVTDIIERTRVNYTFNLYKTHFEFIIG